MKFRAILVLVAGLVLASCQTMSKEECSVADWRVIGEQDGAAGYSPQDRFARHVKACTKAGVAPDQTLWYQGYQQGLPRYCTPLNGLSVGSRGKSYANVCPLDLDPGFREGYELGRTYYDRKREISSLESRIRGIEQKIQADQNLISDSKKDKKSKKADRREAERRIRSNHQEIRDLERKAGRMQSRLRRIERDMEDFRYDQAPRG